MKQWPVNKAWFWETAPFFRLLLPFIAGIIAYSSLRIPITFAIAATIIGCMAYVVIAIVRKTNSILSAVHFVLLHLLLFLAAWDVCYLNDIRNDPNWFGKQLHHHAFVARITDTPAEKEKTWKLQLQVLSSIDDNIVHAATGPAIIYVFKNEAVLPFHQGDTIILPSAWLPIKNAGNPFEFDYASYSAHSNLYYLQFLSSAEINIYGRAYATDLPLTSRAHSWCMEQLQRFIHDKAALGLIQAMLIGDEANLDPDLRNAYAETGIIHVIAISGSHIAFFFFIITFMLAWIRNKKYHWLKYALALPFIWGYVLMAGAPPSAVRAALMFSILGVGFALQKQHNTLNQLLATAFFLLCVQPMWLYSAGFQLSFLAVLSLVLFYSPIYHTLQPKNPFLKALWGATVASITAEILVAPLVVWYFHIFPLMFVIANVAAFLFMGVVLIGGMLIILCSFSPPVAGFIADITTWLVNCFHKFVFAIQQFNPSSFLFLNLQPVEFILLYLSIIFIAAYLLKKRKPALFAGLGATCLLFASLCFTQWQAMHQQRLVVYNINGINHIELIEGKYYTVLHTDSISPAKANYGLKPAHTGWYAWQQKRNISKAGIMQIGNRSVLMLDTPVTEGQAHVDYVIVNFKPKPYQLKQVYDAFTPKAIVIGSQVSRRQSGICKSLCDSLRIPLHATQSDGAFVLSAI